MSGVLQKRKERQAAIHAAAIREFARSGLEGTSTQAIATSAGISKAQLHYYISSKEDLYQQVLGDIITQFRDIFFLQEPQEDPADALASYIERKIRHVLDYPEITRLFAREVARGAPEMANHWPVLKASVEEASAVISAWIESGKIAPVDPLYLQMHLWATTQYYAEYEVQNRRLLGLGPDAPFDADRIIAELTDLFLLRCGLPPRASR